MWNINVLAQLVLKLSSEQWISRKFHDPSLSGSSDIAPEKKSKKIDPDDLEICSRSLSFKLDVHPYMGDQL